MKAKVWALAHAKALAALVTPICAFAVANNWLTPEQAIAIGGIVAGIVTCAVPNTPPE